MTTLTVVLLITTLLQYHYVNSDEHTYLYQSYEEVVVWMNTVGPYDNRQETYPFFNLPLCKGSKKHIDHYHETMGEALLGIHMEFSGLNVLFRKDVIPSKYCKVQLVDQKFYELLRAIRKNYRYELSIDDLPLWGSIGEVERLSDGTIMHYLWTHKRFEIGYSWNQIVEAEVIDERRVLLEPGIEIGFTYEVNWFESDVNFKNRYYNLLDRDYWSNKVHWLSLLNSFLMAVFLVSVVLFIFYKTLLKDYVRYFPESILDIDSAINISDDYGWKQVRKYMFKLPPNPQLLTSLVSTGIQLLALSLTVVLIAWFSEIFFGRGKIISLTLYCYIALFFIKGYIAGMLNTVIFNRKLWIRQCCMMTFLFPAFVAILFFVVNFIALNYGTTRTLSLTRVLVISNLGMCFSIPLAFFGFLCGRNCFSTKITNDQANLPYRPIPRKPFLLRRAILIILSGLLPFACIFIETYFVFTSFWNYKIYSVYGFLFFVLLVLVSVTSCVSITVTYLMLNTEDYRWQWASFLSGFSISGYIYLYAVYYFFAKTAMFGIYQTVFYFTYAGLFSISIGLIAASVSFLSATIFVYKLYSAFKIE